MRRAAILVVLLLGTGLAACIGTADETAGDPSEPPSEPQIGPLVTIAHVDTGINPYHHIWRSSAPYADDHPSTYLPGYPADAIALPLSLDAPDWQSAMEADADVWATTLADTLYYVPGTRLVGLINLGPPLSPDPHGHGTMTASRAAGPDSLAPEALFVSAQGLGADRVRWIADQGWIDVQTNSWGSLVPLPSVAGFSNTPDTIADAAGRMPVVFASGNGNGFNGAGPNPTWMSQTAPPGTVQVGGHDNGHLTLWHGAPAHVVADYFGGPHAARDSFDGYSTAGIACCTSAAAPYAAGGLAALVLAARQILDDRTPGITDGDGGERVLASSDDPAQWPPAGPLSDGILTVAEALRLFLVTAQVPVREGPHDGARHWGTDGRAPEPTNPAGNPYCQLCWGTPVEWSGLPQDLAYLNVGYGAIDPDSAAQAVAVLLGEADMPVRPDEDLFFQADLTVRNLLYG